MEKEKMTWIKYECGCIEGPVVSGICPIHGRRPGAELIDCAGIAELINCVKDRPIKCWITNGECDERRMCPTSYDDCKYKWRKDTQRSML